MKAAPAALLLGRKTTKPRGSHLAALFAYAELAENHSQQVIGAEFAGYFIYRRNF